MRKKNYNSLGATETSVKTNTLNPTSMDKVHNQSKLSSVKKWVLAFFMLVFVTNANSQISLTATGGTTTGSYTTIKDAFDAINANTHFGTIAITVNANTTETAQAVLFRNTSGATRSIVIKPAAATTPTISGSIGTSIIKLSGADSVTIDGSNTNGGTTRDLTIKNNFFGRNAVTGTGTLAETVSTVIWLASEVSGSNGATFNTIKNCIVRGSSNRTTYAAIVSSRSDTTGGSSITAPFPGTVSAANSNNTISNNSLGYAQHVLRFNTSSFVEPNLTITNNNIDSAFTNGIFVQNQSNCLISGNTLNNLATDAATYSGTIHGIQINGSVTTTTISFNKIIKVRQNSTSTVTGFSARGITLATNTNNANITVSNNFIGDISSFGLTTNVTVHGIIATTTGTPTTATSPIYKIYHNTVNLTTASNAPNTQTSALSISIASATSAACMDVRNNIFANNIPSSSGNTNYWAVFNFTGSTINAFSNLNNNAYYTSNSAIISNNPSTIGTLTAWQIFTSKEANGVFAQPTFTSATDLHLSTVAANASINNGGLPISGITTDIDGATRSVNFPDIGADEIVYTPKISSVTPSSACAGSSFTINGADLSNVTSAMLAGVAAASVTPVSTSVVTAVVASGYSSPVTGTVSVTNAFGSATSTGSVTRSAPGSFVSKNISTGSVGDQVRITGTNLAGITVVTFNGTAGTVVSSSAAEFNVTVPSGATTGDIIITDGCGNSLSAGSFTVNAASPCAAPANQATSFISSFVSTVAMNGSFTDATSVPSGYLVVYSTSALSSGPVDGTTYTAGAGFGGIIVRASSSLNVNLTGLVGNTAYTVTIFAYNGGGCTSGPSYNTTSPLVFNFTTCSNVPNSVVATPVGNNTGNSINFTWTAPTGGGANSLSYMLDVTTDAGFSMPVSGSPFTTSSLSQSVTGLAFATQYYYRIRSNNTTCNSNYVNGTVTTVCGAGTTLPATQNFDAVFNIASLGCWTTEDVNVDGTKWLIGVPTNATGLSGNVLRYNAAGLTDAGSLNMAANDYVYSPGFILTGGTSYTVSFDQANFSNGENLALKYGTAAANASMTTTLWSGVALRNTVAQYVVVTFTPTSSGVYYFGFHCTSNAYNGTPRAIYQYVDNFRLLATPPPPAAPSGLVLNGVTASSITANWTDNANNEDFYKVYYSTDGTNYSLAATVAANVTTATFGNLNSNTLHYVRVVAENSGGQSSNLNGTTTTLDCMGVYTTNTFIGTIFIGTVADWNSASNWSLGHSPTSCENVVINANNLQESTTTINYLYLNADATMHDLTLSASNSPLTSGVRQALFVYTNGFKMKITGNLTMSNDSSGNNAPTTDNLLLIAGGGSGGASIIVEGTANIGMTGNRLASIGGASGFADIVFKGNVNLGPQAFLNYGSLVYYVFDGNGAQTLTMTSTQNDGSTTYGLGNLTIGRSNNTVLTLAGTGISAASSVVGDFLINTGSSLIIPSGQRINRTVFGGTFTMGSNTTLKIGGVTGGVSGSNFPSNFAGFTLNSNSTVQYNGVASQKIARDAAYAKLNINNAAGVMLDTNNVTVNTSLDFTAGILSTGSNRLILGEMATVTGAGTTAHVNGTLQKVIAAATASKSFEIGDGTNYTPVSVSFAGGSTNSGGLFSAKTTAGMPSTLGFTRSGISTTDYLNRTYTLKTSGITGATSITPTYNYVTGDFVGAASSTGYVIADSTSGGGWSVRGTSNTATSSSVTSSGLGITVPAEYNVVIGQVDPAPAPDVTSFTPTSACEASTYVITGSNFYAISSITIGATNVPTFTVNSPTQITITIPVAAGDGVISVTNATGTSSTTGTLITNAQPQTTVSNATQTICSGETLATMVLGNTGNISGTTYSWTRTGNNISGGTNAASGTTDIMGTITSSSTIPETVSYSISSSANGCIGTTTSATVTLKASAGVVSLTPNNAAICENNTQQLVANYTAATGSTTKNSGVITVGIPDGNIAGVNTLLNINNVPTGAIITGMEVGFDITHTWTADLAVNLTAPNGKTLNLAYQVGGDGIGNASGKDFYHTVVSSTGVAALPFDVVTDSMTGTWAPDAISGVGPSAFVSNVTNFAGLYSVANGNWRLSARDYGTPDVGTIKNWYITLHYTLSPTFAWTPSAGLFTDAGFTAYTGGSQQTVYVKNTPGTYNYYATITHNGCVSRSDTAIVTIEAIPVATRSIASQTICSGTSIASILLAASNDPTAILSWTRNENTDVTGIAANGTGDITGSLTNVTSSPITVTFTITANGTGSQSCPGNTVTSTVTVNPIPLVTANPLSQSVCSGSPISPIIFGTTNSVAGSVYQWTRDNVSTSTGIAANGSTFVSGTLTNTGATTTVTFAINAVGPGVSACAGTPINSTVTVYNPATIFTVSGSGHFCSPATGLNVLLSGSQVGYDYQLFNAGIALGSPIAGTGSGLNFGSQAAGTYTVTATNGCLRNMSGSAVITTSAVVTPTISIASSSASDTVCSGSVVTFTATATNTTSPVYQWKRNGVNAGTGISLTFAPNTLVTNDVITCDLTITNPCATTQNATSNSITVQVKASPSIGSTINYITGAVTNTALLCRIGDTIKLANYSSGSNSSWTSSNPAVATAASFSYTNNFNRVGFVIARAAGTATISYGFAPTSVGGCSPTAGTVVTVAPILTTLSPITGSSSVCVGSTTALNTSSTGGVWSSVAGLATVNTSGVVTGRSAGNAASIRYTVSNSAGCSIFVSKAIAVNAIPGTPTIGYKAPFSNPQQGAPTGGFCVGKVFGVAGNPTGGVWSASGIISVTVGGVATINSVGTGSLTYTATNVAGCSNSRTMTGIGVTCASRGTNVNASNEVMKNDNLFTMYPNPAKYVVSLQVEKLVGEGQAIITDVYGKQVKIQTLSMGNNLIDIANLSKGFYLVSMITSEGKTTKKLVVE